MKTKQNYEKLTMTDFSFNGEILNSFSILFIYSFEGQFYHGKQTMFYPLSDYLTGLNKIIPFYGIMENKHDMQILNCLIAFENFGSKEVGKTNIL